MKFNRAKAFIILFSLLYICVGFVSTYHAIAFFSLANAMFLGVILACTFEIGQATVLFSILSSKKDRSKVMPWVLMTILTFVQVLGNVFSTYKYLMTNSLNELKYFKEPVLWWTELPDQTCNVILTYIIGAILPIVALCMTGMVETFLEDSEEENIQPKVTESTSEKVDDPKKQEEDNENKEVKVEENNTINEVKNEETTQILNDGDDVKAEEAEEPLKEAVQSPQIVEVDNTTTEEVKAVENEEKEVVEHIEEKEEKLEEVETPQIEENKNEETIKRSRFINLK